MLLQDLQVKLVNARKASDKVALSLLQVLLGDLATVKARSNKEPTEEQIDDLIRNVRDKNNETLGLLAGKSRESDESKLKTENVYLNSLLPKTLTVEEIQTVLVEVKEQLIAAKSDGQAVGVAMKFLKPKGLKVLGDDVKKAVETMRC